jgi:spore maturation protein CgeB
MVENNWADRSFLSILRSGFDETIFKPIPNISKDVDVLFIGTLTRRREKTLGIIGQTYNIKVVSAFGEEMNEWVNRSKIILNIHAEEYLDTETRVFEVLGCGGFLLTEKLSPENPFADDELVQYDTIDDCMDKISFYLKEPGLRETIAQKGHQTAIRKHTYTDRAGEIAKIMLPFVRSSGEPDKNLDELSIRLYGLEESFNRNIMIPGYKTRELLIKKTKSIIRRL